MKNSAGLLALVLLIVIATACTAATNDASETGDDLTEQIIHVHIVLPEQLASEEDYELRVEVTQGEEAVEDASEIQFEIWKAQEKANSERILADHAGGGAYTIKHTFSEDGIYYVQTHVTARGMHVMPQKRFIVGDVSEEELQKIEQEGQHDDHEHDDGHEHHH